MKKLLILAVTAIATGLAFNAQAANREDNIAALSDPAAHVSALRPEVVARIMHEQGYTQLRKMRYTKGTYIVRALKAGKGWRTVRVNAASGMPIFN